MENSVILYRQTKTKWNAQRPKQTGLNREEKPLGSPESGTCWSCGVHIDLISFQQYSERSQHPAAGLWWMWCLCGPLQVSAASGQSLLNYSPPLKCQLIDGYCKHTNYKEDKEHAKEGSAHSDTPDAPHKRHFSIWVGRNSPQCNVTGLIHLHSQTGFELGAFSQIYSDRKTRKVETGDRWCKQVSKY